MVQADCLAILEPVAPFRSLRLALFLSLLFSLKLKTKASRGLQVAFDAVIKYLLKSLFLIKNRSLLTLIRSVWNYRGIKWTASSMALYGINTSLVYYNRHHTPLHTHTHTAKTQGVDWWIHVWKQNIAKGTTFIVTSIRLSLWNQRKDQVQVRAKAHFQFNTSTAQSTSFLPFCSSTPNPSCTSNFEKCM